ncbi:hypothetical protein ACFL6S_28715 [Candidatus Poribacteria bacterium]
MFPMVILAVLALVGIYLIALPVLDLAKAILRIRSCPKCGRRWALQKTGLKRRSPLSTFIGTLKWWREYKCRYCENTEWMVFGSRKCPGCGRRGTVVPEGLKVDDDSLRGYGYYRCIHCNYMIWRKRSFSDE